tara:strand:+ start:1907 stop:2905 length:999 start_codon:yes stop_codon:yes gene_type:complete
MAITKATDKIVGDSNGNLNLSGIVTASSFIGSGSGLTGVASTDNIKTSTTANFTGGIQVGGATTLTGALTGTTGTFSSNVSITGNLGVGGVLTYEDVTNIDSVGIVTARSGMKIGPTAGVAGTFFADGSYVTAGVITATTFHGSGANLTGIDATAIQTGNTVVQTNASRIDSKVSNVGILTVTSAGINVTGVVTATSFVGSGANLTGIQGIPTGVIMIWSGASDAIPSGFVLCNGSNSTPDLRNRFIVGAADTYSVGATGGATSTNAVLGSVVVYVGTEDNPNQVQDASSSYNGIQNKSSRDRHQHGLDMNHTHSNIPTVPPYYALCYIMKT